LLGGGGRVDPGADRVPAQRTDLQREKRSWVKNVAMIGGLTIGLVYAVRSAFFPAAWHETKPASAPAVVTAPAAPAVSEERWGTRWCWPDARREGVLPIDDSDMGCSCSSPKCIPGEAWVRQHAGLTLLPGDALTDNGQEVWNLLAARRIEHVLICGVHLNMCVLGRPFAIRQLTYLGKQVALIRDLTDTMYNPERPPGVDHFAGNDLVVEHVEKFWCPSLVSTDLTVQPPFRFKADQRQR